MFILFIFEFSNANKIINTCGYFLNLVTGQEKKYKEKNEVIKDECGEEITNKMATYLFFNFF